MNLRRALMASGSLHLWKDVAAPLSSGVQNYRLWKVACTTIAVPSSAGLETSEAAPSSAGVETCEVAPSSAGVETCEAAPIKPDLCDEVSEKVKVASRQMEKRKIFQKLRSLTVETIDLIIREEENKGVIVSQSDLISWAKLLAKKHGKPENALEIFRWMDKKKMPFYPSEVGLYLGLIAKVKGLDAAEAYFGKVDPNFNVMDPRARNWPAFAILTDLWEKNKNTRYGFQRHSRG